MKVNLKREGRGEGGMPCGRVVGVITAESYESPQQSRMSGGTELSLTTVESAVRDCRYGLMVMWMRHGGAR